LYTPLCPVRCSFLLACLGRIDEPGPDLLACGWAVRALQYSQCTREQASLGQNPFGDFRPELSEEPLSLAQCGSCMYRQLVHTCKTQGQGRTQSLCGVFCTSAWCVCMQIGSGKDYIATCSCGDSDAQEGWRRGYDPLLLTASELGGEERPGHGECTALHCAARRITREANNITPLKKLTSPETHAAPTPSQLQYSACPVQLNKTKRNAGPKTLSPTRTCSRQSSNSK